MTLLTLYPLSCTFVVVPLTLKCIVTGWPSPIPSLFLSGTMTWDTYTFYSILLACHMTGHWWAELDNHAQSTSQWTLDYPPLFAWFEWLLSLAAAQVDPLMVRIQSTPYASPNCILYQRFTVIVSDLTLFYALLQSVPPSGSFKHMV